MEGEIDANTELDYATLQLSSAENMYEAVICRKGRTEKLASGPLSQLALHLSEAERFQSNLSTGSFKLQPEKMLKGSSWFTKTTLALFLHIVNSSEALNSIGATANEIFQLEETRLTLCSKDHADHSASGVTGVFLEEEGSTKQMKIETVTSDTTKNELLCALDLRLMALKEEMVASFNKAAGSNSSSKQITDLVAFAEHFGAVDLRNSLEKYLSIISNGPTAEPSVEPLMISHDSDEMCALETCQPWTSTTKPVKNSVSPAKLAQVERQSSSESEDSFELSDEDQAVVERSRPAVRSASPRRSSSPMRRIQIGRSGSRRSTTLTIKSLNYFPARERTSLNRGADESNSGDEESDQPLKKPDAAARILSVQDAISLFERKQKDQIMDTQKKRASGDVSSTTNKSVLRRWSAGMHDCVTDQSQEITSDTLPQRAPSILVPEVEEKILVEEKDKSNVLACNLVQPDSLQGNTFGGTSSEVNTMASLTSPSFTNPMELVKPQMEGISSQATVSAEWNRQKEAELNQMLMKMMESKTGKHKGTKSGSSGVKNTSNEQKGVSNSLNKKKMDEKRQAENAGKRAAKKAQFEILKGSLGQSKGEIASKSGGIAGKHISPVPSQRPRRNSAPPVFQKEEVSKQMVSKKASPRSAVPATRNSWSSGPLPKTSDAQVTRSSPKIVSSIIPPSRQKVQTTSSSTKPGPSIERPSEQKKTRKVIVTHSKPAIKGQEEKKLQEAGKTNKSVKTRGAPSLGDDSGLMAKPTYSKFTKKSTVVPLESKPFLRKSTKIGPGGVPVLAKTKASQANVPEESKDLIRNADKESTPITTESISKEVEVSDAQSETHADADVETLPDNDLNIGKTENADQSLTAPGSGISNLLEFPTVEMQPDGDMGISSAAWEELENQEISTSRENNLLNNAISPVFAPTLSSSPCIHPSLSQMLQTDNNEPEIEWGNAENPPALIYQKDAPKGLKRLLKFARKNKGEASMTGWSSPSVFSEGEDDLEESKGANKYSDLSLRKSSLKAKGYGHQKTTLNESSDYGNSSKRSPEYRGVNENLSGQSSNSILKLEKLREGHASVAATSTKGTRSFFSLSTFRSSKWNDAKPQ